MASSSTVKNLPGIPSDRSKQDSTTWDPLRATPRRTFHTTAVSEQDVQPPFICDVLTARDGRVLLGDNNNKMVKILTQEDPSRLTCVRLDGGVRRMARLAGHTVAVNTDIKMLVLLDTSQDDVSVRGRHQTARQYIGITQGSDDVTLIAGCWKDDDGPARVDVIRLDGTVVKTVADESSVPGLRSPCQPVLVGDRLHVPDLLENCLYVMELSCGRLVEAVRHDDIQKPTQVLVDGAGNLYVVSYEGQCVLVRGSGGQWRRLLVGKEDGVQEFIFPWAACLTSTGIVVSWNKDYAAPFVVTGHSLL